MPHSSSVTILLFVLVLIHTRTSSCATYYINNSVFSVGLTVGDDHSLYVSSFQLNKTLGGGGGLSSNLLHNGGTFDKSGTAIKTTSSTTWNKPSSAKAPITSGTSISLDDVTIGSIAREVWSIELAGSCIQWQISRQYIADSSVVADQSPALFFNSGVTIPGFLDPTLITSGPSGFLLDQSSLYYEVLSSNLTQTLRLAPLNIALGSQMRTSSGGFFSFGKYSQDGTSPFVSLGIESVNRSTTYKAYKKGDTFTTSWLMCAAPDLGGSDLTLSIPNDRTTEILSKKLVATHNNYMGFAFGNNPASVICLHEMGWFPLLQGILATNDIATLGMRKNLEFLIKYGINNSSGYVYPRWQIRGFLNVIWGPLHDQVPHMIIAIYYHVLRTGDKGWLKQHIGSIDLVAKYMISLDTDGDGVLEVPGASGLSDGGQHTSNWYDIIEFGHKDAYIATYANQALRALADMHLWLGDQQSSNYYNTLYTKWVAGFNTVFWNSKLGYYSDWVDVKNVTHSYFYTDTSLLSIIFGFSTPSQSKSILAALDAQYVNLCTKFNVKKETTFWATPSNMVPVTVLGDMVGNGTLQNQKDFPNYENGCAFYHSTGFEVAARAIAGDPDSAYEIYRNMLSVTNGMGQGLLWSAAVNWKSKSLISEPLSSGMMGTWGLIRGCFGVWPTLNNGLSAVGTPASVLEGATTQFEYLGSVVTLTVKNGKVVIS